MACTIETTATCNADLKTLHDEGIADDMDEFNQIQLNYHNARRQEHPNTKLLAWDFILSKNAAQRAEFLFNEGGVDMNPPDPLSEFGENVFESMSGNIDATAAEGPESWYA